MLKRRRKIIEFYNRELSDQSVSVLQHYSEKEKFISSGHLYLVKLMWQDEEYRNNGPLLVHAYPNKEIEQQELKREVDQMACQEPQSFFCIWLHFECKIGRQQEIEQ